MNYYDKVKVDRFLRGNPPKPWVRWFWKNILGNKWTTCKKMFIIIELLLFSYSILLHNVGSEKYKLYVVLYAALLILVVVLGFVAVIHNNNRFKRAAKHTGISFKEIKKEYSNVY